MAETNSKRKPNIDGNDDVKSLVHQAERRELSVNASISMCR